MSKIFKYTLIFTLGTIALAGLCSIGNFGYFQFSFILFPPLQFLLGIVLVCFKKRRMYGQAMLLSAALCLLLGFFLCSTTHIAI